LWDFGIDGGGGRGRRGIENLFLLAVKVRETKEEGVRENELKTHRGKCGGGDSFQTATYEREAESSIPKAHQGARPLNKKKNFGYQVTGRKQGSNILDKEGPKHSGVSNWGIMGKRNVKRGRIPVKDRRSNSKLVHGPRERKFWALLHLSGKT